jgi:hypothetical protein
MLMRIDKVALWFTLGLGLMGIGAAAGVPIGLAMATRIPELLVAVIFAIVFGLGLYMVIAPIAGWPLPEISGNTDKPTVENGEEERERKERERKERERKERERKERERKEREEAQRAMIRALNEDSRDGSDEHA